MAQWLLIHEAEVGPELLDYNGHLTEWAYFRIFSDALTKLIGDIGVGKEHRRQTGGTMYSLESRGLFFKEARLGAKLAVTARLLDFNDKRMHVLLDLHNGDVLCAAYENVSVYVRQSVDGPPRSAPFPAEAITWFEEQKAISDTVPWPPHAGRGLSISRKPR
jgi:acyl-CoA thioester hydrolase